MSGNRLMAAAMGIANAAVAQSPQGGALPQLYAAVAPEVEGGDYLGPGGPFELRGSPKKVRAAKRAYREADAERLWQASEERSEEHTPELQALMRISYAVFRLN